MKYIIQLITLFALVFTVNTALAKGGKPPPAPEPGLLNVVTVSPQYGDYTSPVDALNSITNAAEDNQYVIQIGPGTYDLGNAQIIMKPWVRIEGAGTIFTIIRGSRSSMFNDDEAAIVIGADNSALIGLSVENKGGGAYSIGIRNNNASQAIKHVRVNATGSVTNSGISINNSHSKLVNVSTGSGDGLSENYIGIGIYNNSSPYLLEVSTLPLHGNGTGVIVNNAAPFIVDSQLSGDPGLELADNAGGRVVNNLIIGGVLRAVSYTGGTVCRGNYDSNLDDVDCAVITTSD